MNQTNNYNRDVNHKSITTFQQLNISNSDYLKALDRLNFLQPTPIQILSIPLGIQNNNINLIAQAKAGTGKTLAFSSIIFERLYHIKDQIQSDSNPQVLILLPTRELAIQVYEFIETLLTTIKSINPSLFPHLNSALFIGGLPLQDDRRNLKMQHVKIIIGTIGRVVALIKENSLALTSVNTFVMDEADKLMSQKDFYKHISFIFDSLQKQKGNNRLDKLIGKEGEQKNDKSKDDVNKKSVKKEKEQDENESIKIKTNEDLGEVDISQNQDKNKDIEQIKDEKDIIINEEEIQDLQKDIKNDQKVLDKQDNEQNQQEKEEFMNVLKKRMDNKKNNVQYLAFSATYPQDLKQKLEKLMKTSQFVDAIALQNESNNNNTNQDEQNQDINDNNRDLNLENITQFRIDIKQHQTLSITKQKIQQVIDFLKNLKFNQAIIFYNDKIKGENLYSELKSQDYSVIFIHGDQSQADRIKIMNQIRRNKTDIIIATDLLSRGIDINTIDVVINYDIPSTVETYYHRIGRTGRYGRFGVSLVLVQQHEDNFIQQNIIHFSRLQDLPQDYTSINEQLQSKTNQTVAILDNTNQSNNQRNKKTNPPPPQTYYHEFTQGIIREEVALEEKFYDDSNFKYFQEESYSPIILNQDGNNELSGSMFSDGDDFDDDEEEDYEGEDEDVENNDDDDEENGEQNNSINEKNNIKKDIQKSIKKMNNSELMNHECTQQDESEWGFLSCSICYRFLQESQKQLNKTFEILKFFNLPENK